MLKNALGHIIDHERVVFPLVSFTPSHLKFRCLGTGFFIFPTGWFITAKHVLFDNKGNLYDSIYAIQTLSTGKQVIRVVTELSIHENADVAVGQLGLAFDGDAKPMSFEISPILKMSFQELNQNENVMAFGYPRTMRNDVGTKTTFNFTGIWSNGNVINYMPHGSPLVRNRCYHTSMKIDSGASGGPVFMNNSVIGINSSGMDIEHGEEPISFITPLDYVQELKLEVESGSIKSIGELIAENILRIST